MGNENTLIDYNHISVDVETLSLRQDAVILTLGAVLFNPCEVQTAQEIADNNPTFYAHLDVMDQIRKGYHVDAGTSQWWHAKSFEAREAAGLTGKYETQTNKHTLMRLAGWMVNFDVKAMWADPNHFDLGLIRMHSQKEEAPLRITHNNMLDGSTLCSLRGVRYGQQRGDEIGFRHHALYDAINQAAQIQMSLGEIDEFGIRGYPTK